MFYLYLEDAKGLFTLYLKFGLFLGELIDYSGHLGEITTILFLFSIEFEGDLWCLCTIEASGL